MAHTPIVAKDLHWESVLLDTKKSKNPLQPLYEAFTNALESIKLLGNQKDNGKIGIRIFQQKDLAGDGFIFQKIEVEDTGIGFDDENFKRLNIYKDTRKGFHNRGSGRIQLIHSFDESCYESIYKSSDTYRLRRFYLSKHFLRDNAIVAAEEPTAINATQSKTKLILRGLRSEKEDGKIYHKLTAASIKKDLITHYMMEFCVHRKRLPEICIETFIGDTKDETLYIKPEDIPSQDKERNLSINYLKLSEDGKSFEPTGKTEQLKMVAFKIDDKALDKNEIKLTSKGEIVDGIKIKLNGLNPKDTVNSNRFLFLISGEFIDQKDVDSRGEFSIPTKTEFKKAQTDQPYDLFPEGEIFLDDITDNANNAISGLYTDIKTKIDEKEMSIAKLKEMFLLNDKTIESISFKIDDSEEKVLERVYEADAKVAAEKDAEIKKTIDTLNMLDPTACDYSQKLNEAAIDIVKQIPMQNRVVLTRYVARRKLVLELFDKILKRELEVQKQTKRNVDEKLLHNLIFKQTSTDPEQSDLWLISEDFLYFKGASEQKLCDIKIDGKHLFKRDVTAEEDAYLSSLGENRKITRPDILLFPNEGKCILIELKNPDVNVSDHLNQVMKYSSIIRNFSEDSFQIDTFYGYLIGQAINTEDVQSADSDFKEAANFGYLFRPFKTIIGKRGRAPGSLYTEVISYTSLLERARKRNETFIKKLSLAPHTPAEHKNVAETGIIDASPKPKPSLPANSSQDSQHPLGVPAVVESTPATPEDNQIHSGSDAVSKSDSCGTD